MNSTSRRTRSRNTSRVHTTIIIDDLPSPWRNIEVAVFLVRDDRDEFDCWAYFTRTAVCNLLGWDYRWMSYKDSFVWEHVPELKKSKIHVELGNVAAYLKTLPSVPDDPDRSRAYNGRKAAWSDPNTIDKAIIDLENAIEDAIKRNKKISKWSLCTSYTHQPQAPMDIDYDNDSIENESRRTSPRKATQDYHLDYLRSLGIAESDSDSELGLELELESESEPEPEPEPERAPTELSAKPPAWFNAAIRKSNEELLNILESKWLDMFAVQHNTIVARFKKEVHEKDALQAYSRSKEFQKRKREYVLEELDKLNVGIKTYARSLKKKRKQDKALNF